MTENAGGKSSTAPQGKWYPQIQWEYNEETGCVCIHDTEPFHEYTVSFLAYIIWDPVHMYNAVTNGWKDFEHQITFDVQTAENT